jgi:hypothetical protein
MELQQVVLARLVQTFRSRAGTFGYFPELAQKLADEYGFIGVPKPEQFLSVETGAEFQHGRVMEGKRSVIIDKLTVFRDGVVIDTTSSTEDCDLILADLHRWAVTAELNLEFAAPRVYVSQVVIKLGVDYEKLSPVSAFVSDMIGSKLDEYGVRSPKYALNSINWHFDQTGYSLLKPGPFTIERRAEVPFNDNLYFSQAPLKTQDHLEMIKSLEKKSSLAQK